MKCLKLVDWGGASEGKRNLNECWVFLVISWATLFFLPFSRLHVLSRFHKQVKKKPWPFFSYDKAYGTCASLLKPRFLRTPTDVSQILIDLLPGSWPSTQSHVLRAWPTRNLRKCPFISTVTKYPRFWIGTTKYNFNGSLWCIENSGYFRQFSVFSNTKVLSIKIQRQFRAHHLLLN